MSDVSATLAERGGRYGSFYNHAQIAQGLQDVMRAAPNWDKLDADMRQALSVIADKIARILNGDPYYTDNYHDIQGYARLVEERILKMQEAKEVEDNWEADHCQISWSSDPENKLYCPPEDKVNNSSYDVENYRG